MKKKKESFVDVTVKELTVRAKEIEKSRAFCCVRPTHTFSLNSHSHPVHNNGKFTIFNFIS